MTKHVLLLAVSPLLLLSGCDPRERPAADSAEMNAVVTGDAAADEQAIRGQVDRWLQLVQAKDASGIAQLYHEDGAVMPPGAPISKGREAIEQTWASMMRTPGFDLNISPEQIIISSSGDMALDRGTYQLTISAAGSPQTDTGKYVVVWRKVDGVWKAAADIFNSDGPPGEG